MICWLFANGSSKISTLCQFWNLSWPVDSITCFYAGLQPLWFYLRHAIWWISSQQCNISIDFLKVNHNVWIPLWSPFASISQPTSPDNHFQILPYPQYNKPCWWPWTDRRWTCSVLEFFELCFCFWLSHLLWWMFQPIYAVKYLILFPW